MRHSSAPISIYVSVLSLSAATLTFSCAPDLKVGSNGGGGGAGSTSSSSSGGGTGGGEGGMGAMGGMGGMPNSTSSSSASSSGGQPGELGTPCVNDIGCASGHCADGVCCDETCNGTCMKCNQIGAVGTCTTVPVAGDDCDVEGELCNAMKECACGVSKPPTLGPSCPLPWVDGPKAGSCLMQCDAPGACSNGITCPPGFDCYVECSGDGSCSGINADVECPESHICDVTCTGANSCQADFRVRCSEKGPCALHCGSASEACKGAEIRCGSNACSTTCAGSMIPAIDPGSSCSVTGC